ncbi:MAG: hypothetical protein KF858_12705 [Candidatus Sumerlaeia bacterium]|nr:hypothetical protein [Candidatus Sumerlaeia bacterium]
MRSRIPGPDRPGRSTGAGAARVLIALAFLAPLAILRLWVDTDQLPAFGSRQSFSLPPPERPSLLDSLAYPDEALPGTTLEVSLVGRSRGTLASHPVFLPSRLPIQLPTLAVLESDRIVLLDPSGGSREIRLAPPPLPPSPKTGKPVEWKWASEPFFGPLHGRGATPDFIAFASRPRMIVAFNGSDGSIRWMLPVGSNMAPDIEMHRGRDGASRLFLTYCTCVQSEYGMDEFVDPFAMYSDEDWFQDFRAEMGSPDHFGAGRDFDDAEEDSDENPAIPKWEDGQPPRLEVRDFHGRLLFQKDFGDPDEPAYQLLHWPLDDSHAPDALMSWSQNWGRFILEPTTTGHSWRRLDPEGSENPVQTAAAFHVSKLTSLSDEGPAAIGLGDPRLRQAGFLPNGQRYGSFSGYGRTYQAGLFDERGRKLATILSIGNGAGVPDSEKVSDPGPLGTIHLSLAQRWGRVAGLVFDLDNIPVERRKVELEFEENMEHFELFLFQGGFLLAVTVIGEPGGVLLYRVDIREHQP